MTTQANLNAIQTNIATLKAAGDVVDATDGISIRFLNNNPSASPAYASTARPPNNPDEEVAFALRQVAKPDDYKITGDRTTRNWMLVRDEGDAFTVIARIPKV